MTRSAHVLRVSANLEETQLTVANVKQKFGKLWTLFADGQIVAQPLYVSGLKVDGKGTFNAVIVSTMHNTIFAYDADKKPTMPQSQDALIWAQWLGQPQPESFSFVRSKLRLSALVAYDAGRSREPRRPRPPRGGVGEHARRGDRWHR